jgi:hypothetical protein
MVRFIQASEKKRGSRHLVWMSCVAGGGADENAALFSSPADIVSPCESSDARYVDNPPRSPLGKIVIADSDHIGPGRVRVNWVWRSMLRGLHPIYMDLAADSLPWYQGTELGQDPRIAAQIRRALGAVQSLAAILPLETMVPQDASAHSPVATLAGEPPFALFSTDSPVASQSSFDGAVLVALEPSGGQALRVCGLSPGEPYVARWLRTIDITTFGATARFVAPEATQRPSATAPRDPSREIPGREEDSCRRFTNPDADSGKLLFLRRVEPEAEHPSPAGAVE